MKKCLTLKRNNTLKNHRAKNIKQNYQQNQGREKELQNKTNFELVAEFMTAFEQDVYSNPTLRDPQTRALRHELIREELEELDEAMGAKDIIEVADALTDLLYVVYGAGHAFGIDLDACFLEVHESNMSKLGEDGKPIKRFDGKVQKGPRFFTPDLESILNSQ